MKTIFCSVRDLYMAFVSASNSFEKEFVALEKALF